MICSGKDDWIHRYLDSEMDPSEQAGLEEHLTVCETCQRELAQTRALFALLDRLAEVPVPAELGQEVMTGLTRQPASPAVKWLLMGQVLLTSALLLLALPRLAAWYERACLWFAPGWLSSLVEGVTLLAKSAWIGLASTLAVDVNLAWPRGLGLTWTQAAVVAVALGGMWLLGNRLLFATKPNGTGGMR